MRNEEYKKPSSEELRFNGSPWQPRREKGVHASTYFFLKKSHTATQGETDGVRENCRPGQCDSFTAVVY